MVFPRRWVDSRNRAMCRNKALGKRLGGNAVCSMVHGLWSDGVSLLGLGANDNHRHRENENESESTGVV
jgi:hypothetical protein